MNNALIEKIRKLRALATSSNVHEAAAAAAAAERLIQEHAISEVELEAPTVDPVASVLEIFGQRVTTWKAALLQAIEKNHGCTGYINNVNGATVWTSIGRPEDLETVRYLYAWLTAEITRLVIPVRGRTARNSFCLGAVHGLRDAMLKAREEVRASATSQALAVIDARLAAAEDKLPGNLRMTRRNASIDSNAYTNGVEAGRNIHQRQGLGQGGARLLGTGR